MPRIDPREVPDPKLRQIAELMTIIGDRTGVGISYFIANKTAPGQIDGCFGVWNMDNHMMDAFATSINKCDALQDAISRTEHLTPSKFIVHRRQMSISRFMARIKELLE